MGVLGVGREGRREGQKWTCREITRELMESVRKKDREKGDRVWEEVKRYNEEERASFYHLRLLLLSLTTSPQHLNHFFSFITSIPTPISTNPSYPILYSSNLQLNSAHLVDTAYYLCESFLSSPSPPSSSPSPLGDNNNIDDNINDNINNSIKRLDHITVKENIKKEKRKEEKEEKGKEKKRKGIEHGIHVVMGGCVGIRDPTRSMETMKAMAGFGIPPSLLSYNLLLSSYLQCGLYSAIDRTVEEMIKEKGIRKDQHTNHLLIQSYVAQSKPHSIRSLLYEELKYEKKRISWKSLSLIRRFLLSSSKSHLSSSKGKMNDKLTLIDINRLLGSFGWPVHLSQ